MGLIGGSVKTISPGFLVIVVLVIVVARPFGVDHTAFTVPTGVIVNV
jgi:hypothetical protein